jgi:putative ABC transport system substrate-binding protein
MKRRTFVAGLGAAAAWPLAARAQQQGPAVVGFLAPGTREDSARAVTGFRQGLKEAGYVEGQNIAIEFRFANGRYDQFRALLDDLVGRQVAVIAAIGAVAAAAAKTATTTIPVVFSVGTDPVASGLVASLNRPGGNLTGAGAFSVALGPKRLELLHELIPSATAVALLINSTNPNSNLVTKELQAAASALGLELRLFQAASEAEIDTVFADMAQQQVKALVIGADTFFSNRGAQIGALTLRHAIPAISQYIEFTIAGGLMSYGSSPTESQRLVGVYAGRILKGEKPADLPVQLTTGTELTINLKTAKALGLSIPLPLLGRADEVIE